MWDEASAGMSSASAWVLKLLTSTMLPSQCTWQTGKERPTMLHRENRRLICTGRQQQQADRRTAGIGWGAGWGQAGREAGE